MEKTATRQAYGKTLVELGAKYDNLVVMDADLSKSTMTAEFAKAWPERFFNMGIAEQNMYAAAAGLAVSGKIVCASTFAMFASGRAFEIIRNSIGYTKANVKICATHAGITVGEDGASHQTFEDMALMRTIPGMTVINPGDGISASALLQQAVELFGPVYLRFGRAAVPAVYDESADIKIGKGNCVRDGGDVTVIATGIMVSKALAAAEKQTVFSMEGDMYKKSKYPDQPDSIKNWLDRKDICFIANSTDADLLFSDKLADRLAQDFKLLEPVYQFLMKAEISKRR